jgi:phosphoadenosine phosphosulfate reductase
LKAEIKEIDLWNHELGSMDASARIEWAVDKFGKGTVASTSFGLQSAVMISLVTQASIDIPILFVDTGYLFPATYEYAAILEEKLNFKVNTFSCKYVTGLPGSCLWQTMGTGERGDV